VSREDTVTRLLRSVRLPVNRENYINLAYFGTRDPNQPLGAEEEAELPEQLQLRFESEEANT
jgi:hypothetical protein